MLLNNRNKYIAYGGILTGLSIIFIYLSYVLPFNKLFMLSIASCLIPIGIIFTNTKNSFLIYISASIVSIILLGINSNTLAYIIFFGIYGIIKNYIEKLRKLPLEIILKLAYLNLCIIIGYLLYKLFIPVPLTTKLPIFILIIFVQIIFLIYDYLLTLIISAISKKYKA